MHAEVGYSEHPDSDVAGMNATARALAAAAEAGRAEPCDLVLVFATAHHDMTLLRAGIAAAAGAGVPVVGGAAIGAIANDRFGYSGEQVILAALWMDGEGFELFSKGGIAGRERAAGNSLGRAMASGGITPDTACILLYDAIHRIGDDVNLNLATPLLEGMEEALGFLPSTLVGAGLVGDFSNSATQQIVESSVSDQNAMLLAFPGDIAIDSVIMHGCKPHGETYTVTKADRQTILEVDGRPALSYIESKLTPRLPAEEFPFFMVFGVNKAPGQPYSEATYANRLCLAVDPAREGIVMFESDMTAGTEFNIMYRSLRLDYIPPKIDILFGRAKRRRRKPVLATYIDCAGRAAGCGAPGDEEEDALVVQNALAGRVPLLGIYSGVEIAPITGRPRTLDWTGVFSLVTVPAD